MEKKEYFFSIIIPSFNCADKLEKALNSVAKQSYKNFEVIVCDSSSDRTKEVIDNFSDKFRLKYIWEEGRGGPAHARNSGLRASQGEYIAFLDADDWWFPSKLEIVTKHLSDADILYHDLDIYTGRGKRIFKKVKGRHLKKPVFIDLMKNENCLITSSVIVKKNVIDKAGGFSEENIMEDFDLWLKVARITEKFFYIPKSLGGYLISKGNRSEASEKMAKMVEAVYLKYFGFLTNEDKEQVRMIMSYILGRIRQKMRLYNEALMLFKISVKAKNKKFKIRSFFWIIFLSIRKTWEQLK